MFDLVNILSLRLLYKMVTPSWTHGNYFKGLPFQSSLINYLKIKTLIIEHHKTNHINLARRVFNRFNRKHTLGVFLTRLFGRNKLDKEKVIQFQFPFVESDKGAEKKKNI